MTETKTYIEARYAKLGPKVAKALKDRHFEAWYFNEPAAALEMIVSIIPKEHSVAWGGSMTLGELGVQKRLAAEGFNLQDRDKAATPEERAAMMRGALLCGTYLTGVNALSEDGQLVNVDAYGNRVAALLFGPEQVIVVAGMNKVVKTPADALARARNYASPLNVQRFDLKTPCMTTGACEDCKSADSICSLIVTMRNCRPAGRIKVVLIGDELGF